jgi:hypothetical protein
MGVAATLKHNFVPSIKSSHRPSALTHKWLKFYSLGLLFSQLLLGISYYSGPSVITENPQIMTKNIINLTNQERTNNNLGEVTENNKLDQAAQAKLNDMFTNDYWDHISPSGKKPWDFIDEKSYSYTYAGENLAKGFVDSTTTVKAWMESQSHKENLLNSRYKEIGVAVGSGKIQGKPTTLVVQIFGTPKDVQIASAQPETPMVMGVKETKVSFNPSYAAIASRLPYFIIWFIIFGLIIFDGGMLRRCGLHQSRKHLFEFRSALLINALVLLILSINFVAIA